MIRSKIERIRVLARHEEKEREVTTKKHKGSRQQFLLSHARLLGARARILHTVPRSEIEQWLSFGRGRLMGEGERRELAKIRDRKDKEALDRGTKRMKRGGARRQEFLEVALTHHLATHDLYSGRRAPIKELIIAHCTSLVVSYHELIF